jgi:hypothetical protein
MKQEVSALTKGFGKRDHLFKLSAPVDEKLKSSLNHIIQNGRQ